MEPWLDNRKECIRVSKGLALSKDSKETLKALDALVNYTLKTRGFEKVYRSQGLSAIPFYASVVAAVQGILKAYPYYCGKPLTGQTLAISTYINPDTLVGVKEPLRRYARAMPEIAKMVSNFVDGPDYSMFIYCYRTLIYVLEEVLLAIRKINTDGAFSALYDLDGAFEELRLMYLRSSKKTNRNDKGGLKAKDFLIVAERCINAIRNVSKAFYVIEMEILKTRHANKRSRQIIVGSVGGMSEKNFARGVEQMALRLKHALEKDGGSGREYA